jgi:hypothetical protein
MNEKRGLIQKVKRLLRRARMPRWLHNFGPKKYEFWQHAIALLVRAICQLSYRRVSWLLRQLGQDVPTYSALIKMTQRMPQNLWQRLLAVTHSNNVYVAAIDSTFFARSNPSYHYLRRIGRIGPVGKPVKANVLVDTRRKKVLAAKIRVLPKGDCTDVPALLEQCAPHIVVADKGYDSEAVHEHCFERGITSMIPARINVKRGFYRRKQLKKFRLKTYHRREMSESKFSSVKRLCGSTIRCRRARTIRAELLARFIASNVFSRTLRLFHQSRRNRKIYNPFFAFALSRKG